MWVCREEKLVLGLSKRTTCADVVKVLLEEQNSQGGLCATQSYCIVEKWRGFERILPHKTRILRLWTAWGEEQKNVKFVLVKSEVSLENHAARSAEARVVRSKQNPGVTKGAARSPMAGISPDKQRRIVRKAFRKLEKINKKRARVAHKDTTSAEKMETLVHRVVSQDHTIRQQIQRIKELDGEIEMCEAKVHFDRMKRHGVNYVQDTYLVGAAGAAASSREEQNRYPAETLAKLEEYALWCEEVVRLQEELWEQEALTDIITVQIQEELNQRWMHRRREELRNRSRGPVKGKGVPSVHNTWTDMSLGSEACLEDERIRTQLDASLYIGLRLSTDLEAVKADLDLTQEMYAAKEQEIKDLLQKVDTMDILDEDLAREETCIYGTDDKTEVKSLKNDWVEGKNEWVEKARGLSKAQDVNDDDSDTGLSSLHSQDSDTLPVWESVV